MTKYHVYIPTNLEQEPEEHEKTAATILANYFRCNVYFVNRGPVHTPDLKIQGKRWEVKSPKGNGKRTIQNNLRAAEHQSCNIVIDLRRIKLSEPRAISRIKYELSRANKIERLLIICKNGNTVAIKDNP